MTVVVIVGTGTEIGKTTFTTAWLRHLRERGRDAVGWKPIETGGDDDERALSVAGGVRIPALYRFAEPISPHLGARRAKVKISLAAIAEQAHSMPHDVTLVESAGGLFSPVDDEGRTNAELAAAVADRVVLVAPNRLGVLHDVEACRRGWTRQWDALALTKARTTDASQTTNLDELRRRVHGPVAFADFALPTEGTFAAFDAILAPRRP